MANFILDSKGRLLKDVFPTIRGDASIGGPEIMEVTVDLSQIGANNTLALLGVPSGLPNAGLGLVAADTIDVAVLPPNSVIRAAHFLLDPVQSGVAADQSRTPDVIATPFQTGPLTVATINIGDATVQRADRQTAQAVGIGSYTASATRVASAQSILTAQDALLAVTGVIYPKRYTESTDYDFVLRIAIATLTGATNVKAGRFRIRLSLDAYSVS
jgi:hypothetical protein